MYKVRRILCSGLLAVVLFLSFGEGKGCSQGLPTIDIQRVLQTAMGIIQDAEASGAFSLFGDLEMKIEDFQKWKEQFEHFKMIYDNLMQGSRYGVEILQIINYFSSEINYMNNCVMWFEANAAAPSIVMALLKCRNDFTSFYKGMSDYLTENCNFIESLRSGNALDLLESITEVLTECRDEFYQITVHFRMEISKLYRLHMQQQAALSNALFIRNTMIY